jgi:hypothetical protein
LVGPQNCAVSICPAVLVLKIRMQKNSALENRLWLPFNWGLAIDGADDGTLNNRWQVRLFVNQAATQSSVIANKESAKNVGILKIMGCSYG